MEYLTLHDMPHRHMYHARRMATPDELRTSERTLPALPTVCASPSSCPCECPSPCTPCSFPLFPCFLDDAVSSALPSPTHLRLPFPVQPQSQPPKTDPLRISLPHRPSGPKSDVGVTAMVPADSLEPLASTAVSSSSAPPPGQTTDTLLKYAPEEPSEQRIEPLNTHDMSSFKEIRRENERLDSVVTICNSPCRLTLPPVYFIDKDTHVNNQPLQHHLTRNSPPVQPNEQPSNSVGLPSFQQVTLISLQVHCSKN